MGLQSINIPLALYFFGKCYADIQRQSLQPRKTFEIHSITVMWSAYFESTGFILYDALRVLGGIYTVYVLCKRFFQEVVVTGYLKPIFNAFSEYVDKPDRVVGLPGTSR